MTYAIVVGAVLGAVPVVFVLFVFGRAAWLWWRERSHPPEEPP